MTQSELDAKWQEILNAAFQTFSEDYLGTESPNGPPTCFGTGDGHDYCLYCNYQRTC